jgi:hypothetical protein
MFNKLARVFASDIEQRIARVEDRIREHLQPRGCGKLWVHHFGATDIRPRYLALCICVATDVERQQIIDSEIDSVVRTWLAEAGYPRDDIKDVGISVDSQETVDRE